MNERTVPELSVVVPCHNEASTLCELVERLRAALNDVVDGLQIVLVDDGSDDGTTEVLAELRANDVEYLSLSRNFGKEAAMFAGLAESRGDLVVFIDGDLQHPPEVVADLVADHRPTGADQVIARRNRDGDPFMRRMSAHLYYRAVNRMVDIRLIDGEGDFRLLSRRASDALLSLTENTRFSKGLFAWIGFPVSVVQYENESRRNGSSSWGLRGLLDYGVDGVLSFNTRPLRSMVHLGWLTVLVFVAYVVWILVNALFIGIITPGFITLVAAVVFLGGVQLLCLGVVGEYVGRIYLESKDRPLYIVAERGTADEVPISDRRAGTADEPRRRSPVADRRR